jgi:hypothetical protein
VHLLYEGSVTESPTDTVPWDYLVVGMAVAAPVVRGTTRVLALISEPLPVRQ